MACIIPILKLTVTYNLTYKVQLASFDTFATPSVVSGQSFTLLFSNTSRCGYQTWFWTWLRNVLLNLILYTGAVLRLRTGGNTIIFGSNSTVYTHLRHLSRSVRHFTSLLLKNTLSYPFLTWIDCTWFVIRYFWVLFSDLPCIDTSKQKNGITKLTILIDRIRQEEFRTDISRQ